MGVDGVGIDGEVADEEGDDGEKTGGRGWGEERADQARVWVAAGEILHAGSSRCVRGMVVSYASAIM